MKIKTAQGSYEVKYVGSLEAEPKAEVKHDDGYVKRDFRESLGRVLMNRTQVFVTGQMGGYRLQANSPSAAPGE